MSKKNGRKGHREANEPQQIADRSLANNSHLANRIEFESHDQVDPPRTKDPQSQTNSVASKRGATGPRTKQGKQRSKYNALKHGIFTGAVLPTEDLAKYEAFWRRLREHFQPEGDLEEILVEQLAMLQWRHRRLLMAESGEISKSIEFDQTVKMAREAMEIEERVVSKLNEFGLFHYSHINPIVLDRCIKLLEGLRERIRERGPDAYFDWQVLSKIYGRAPMEEAPAALQKKFKRINAQIESVSQHQDPQIESVSQHQNAKSTESVIPNSEEEYRRELIDGVDQAIEDLRHFKELREECDAGLKTHQKYASLVPPSEVCDRIIHYERHLSREFDRTLTQLERLQRVRKGQPVPPPLKIELSH